MEAQTDSTTLDMYKWMQKMHENRKTVLIIVGVVAAIGLVAGVITWKKSQDEANANAQLFTYVPMVGNKAPVPAATLQKIAQDYPDTSAGEQAQLLAASTLFTEGKYADSQREFAKFSNDRPQSDLVAQAKVGEAASIEAQGQTADAITKYTDLLTHYAQMPNIVSPAKLTLGRLNEEQGKPEAALKYYDELAKSLNQYDPFAAEARERQVMLLARHPELNKPTPMATAPTMSAAPAASGPLVAPKAK